jgi:hypothetical protein
MRFCALRGQRKDKECGQRKDKERGQRRDKESVLRTRFLRTQEPRNQRIQLFQRFIGNAHIAAFFALIIKPHA